MWRNIFTSLGIMAVTIAAMSVSTYAAFTAQATVSGMSFSTGHAALNLFGNLAYTNAGNNGNLTEDLPGQELSDIEPFWEDDYRLKYFNNGSVKLNTSLTLSINNDSAHLADHIFVETWLWNDVNRNGKVDGSDGVTLLAPKQTLSSLQSSPVPLGELSSGSARGVQLRFSTEDLPSETQDEEASFDFVIQGTTEGTTP